LVCDTALQKNKKKEQVAWEEKKSAPKVHKREVTVVRGKKRGRANQAVTYIRTLQ